MNLFDMTTLYTAALPVRAFADIANDAGYDGGLEWHPVRGLAAGLQVQAGLLNRYEKSSITSLHQSWRSEKSLGEAWRASNRYVAMFSYALLPEKTDSLDNLEHLQKLVGRELPVVLYVPEGDEESGTTRDYGEKLFQPTAQVLQDWKVNSVEELISETYKRGYTGFCIDLFHLRTHTSAGASLDPWQDTLSALLPHTKQIHVAAGRVDIHQQHIDTEAELRDLLHGTHYSELVDMLVMVADQNWSGRVVTEIPAMALHSQRKNSGRFTTIPQLVQDHKQIVENVNAFFG